MVLKLLQVAVMTFSLSHAGTLVAASCDCTDCACEHCDCEDCDCTDCP